MRKKKGAGARNSKSGIKRSAKRTTSAWDPDTAPELTKEYFERADLYHGNKLIRRGRPPSDNPKQALKLRIDPDVVEYFRATGPGWQTRISVPKIIDIYVPAGGCWL
jgi:uncharacterized protein (DUF4415 family)